MNEEWASSFPVCPPTTQHCSTSLRLRACPPAYLHSSETNALNPRPVKPLLTFMLSITSSQFFSDSKEGLSPKGRLFQTNIQTQEMLSGDLGPAGNLPTLFSWCFHTGTLSMLSLSAFAEPLLVRTQPKRPDASSQSTEHQAAWQCV